MGCVSSSSSGHRQEDNQVNNPNHHFDAPSNTKHSLDEVISPKHDMMTIHANTLEKRASFKTLDEYDQLLQRISSNNDVKLTIQDTTDSGGKKDSENDDMGNMDLQKVASLKQWLQAPGGGGAAAAMDYTTPKFGFSFYDNNKAGNNTHMPKLNSVLAE